MGSTGWVNAHPMDAEEVLNQQANITNTLSPQTKTFVYRNSIKALPWFTSVRQLLSDPAYDVWFMPFASGVEPHVPVCDNSWDPPKCSLLYHDQV